MNFRDKAHFKDNAPTRPSPHRPGRRGQGQPLASSLELGKGRAIDIQGSKWSPVPPGTKGTGKKGIELCLAPC